MSSSGNSNELQKKKKKRKQSKALNLSAKIAVEIPDSGPSKKKKKKEPNKKSKAVAKALENLKRRGSKAASPERGDVPAAHLKLDEHEANGISDNADFISLKFDDEEDEEPQQSGEDTKTGNAFTKVAAKLGQFVKDAVTSGKRKRSGNQMATARKKVRQANTFPWLEGTDYSREYEPTCILHRELIAFVNYVGPTLGEHAVRTFVISRVQRIVAKRWPTASLKVFGSFETKLYLPSSDIDMVILSSETGELYEKPQHLRKLGHWLQKAGIAEKVQVITSARVPIVKFIDTVTKINVDISFNKPGGVIAANVVKSYIAKMPALRPMVIFIKHFLNMRGMNEVYLGGLGSYSIICLVISFLQRHPKVAPGQIQQEENLGVLLIEFFELYGKRFNYDLVGISINGPGRYFDKLDYDWQRRGQPYLLSIEDPTDPENDIAKSSFGILKVKATFSGGFDFLVQRIYDTNDQIKQRKGGLDSILSAVISIDEDMISSRELLAECMQNQIVIDELRKLEEDEGEMKDSEIVRKHHSVNHEEFVAENESDDDDDDHLIDEDGRKFVVADGYKKPSNPTDVNDLYTKLNSGRRTSQATNREPMKNGHVDGASEQAVYLIESSDNEEAERERRQDSLHEVIDLSSDPDTNDSKTEQVGRTGRLRYWESKGLAEKYTNDSD